MPVEGVARVLLATKLALGRQLGDGLLYRYEINIDEGGNTLLCSAVSGNGSHVVYGICADPSRAYAKESFMEVHVRLIGNHI